MKLKPCPICGTEPEINPFEGDTSEVIIYCPKCHIQTDEDGECIVTAAESWNTRPAETALLARVREEIEALRWMVDKKSHTTLTRNAAIDDALRAVDEVEKGERT